jgi:heptosyltransferase-2
LGQIVILKTAALGDVLRTTSILPGLHARYRDCRVTWVTSRAAIDLVRTHPLIAAVETVDVASPSSVEAVRKKLATTRWTRVISLDDEVPLCALASSLGTEKLSGAHTAEDGQRAYTADVAPWFDMGLLSTFGKEIADRLKIANTKSHPAIYAEMLGVPMGKPALALPDEALAFATSFAARHRLHENGPLVGLNTGAGGRWSSKQLSVERTVELAGALHTELGGRVTFLVMGGESEVARNRAIVEGLARWPVPLRFAHAGCDNALLPFAALVAECDLLVTSDSLALHIAIAEGVRVVAFFAPTSAAEIELYGLGEKVASTAADYCSYKPDADNSTITVERLRDAALRQLERVEGGSRA